ncbi:hypothetical protein F4604DRAFT_307024 [Suillus subluteus]|nr:hypothetical protein F4604DRAFT_307024 [Suillus subluteus]
MIKATLTPTPRVRLMQYTAPHTDCTLNLDGLISSWALTMSVIDDLDHLWRSNFASWAPITTLFRHIYLPPWISQKIGRFRILVIGRANAGKTTILQRVCNTWDNSEIYNNAGKKVGITMLAGGW